MTWLSVLASCGIAVGAPLVYLDQYLSIERTKTSQGFSHSVCLVLLIANITRLFYWLGERFDTALLVQSILMIIAQFGLLRICLKYLAPIVPGDEESLDPESFNDEAEPSPLTGSNISPLLSAHSTQGLLDRQNNRPLPSPPSQRTFGYYIDFFALLFAGEAALFILLQRYDWFIQTIGFLSLGLESTLPIPQLVNNYRRKSLAGFSSMVLAGWLFGDCFKSIYLIFLTPESNSLQFQICALFQLSIDLLILAQALIYKRKTKADSIELAHSSPPSSTASSNPHRADQAPERSHARLTIEDDQSPNP